MGLWNSNVLPKVVVVGAMVATACGGGGGGGSSSSNSSGGSQSQLGSNPGNVAPSKVNLHLTDAPNPAISNVFVYVDRVEIIVANDSGHAARVDVADNLGLIDLLTLQNGITVAMTNVNVPAGVQVRQIRLFLKDGENYIVKDGVQCVLKTPRAEQSGLKLLLPNSVKIDTGYRYDLVVDFDAGKSIVLQGNGGCLLKPVLRLKTANRLPEVEDNGDNSTPPPAGSGSDIGSGSTTDTSGSGSTGTSASGATDTTGGTTTGGTTSSGGTMTSSDPVPVTLPDGRVIYVDPNILPLLTPEQLLNWQ